MVETIALGSNDHLCKSCLTLRMASPASSAIVCLESLLCPVTVQYSVLSRLSSRLKSAGVLSSNFILERDIV